MSLSKNRISFINSLKLKKFRDTSGQYIIEGDKIIRDLLKNSRIRIPQLIAVPEWIEDNREALGTSIKEVIEVNIDILAGISSFETPPPVMAVMDMPAAAMDIKDIAQSLCIGLDTVQDPGNVGTIIRTANWFGIRNIICSPGCADCYNPKVIQASMGALVNVNIHYTDLEAVLQTLKDQYKVPVYGTYMQGQPVFELSAASKGIILFGNEARGLSKDIEPYVTNKLTIPSSNPDIIHVESLNVASAVAIVCSWLVHK